MIKLIYPKFWQNKNIIAYLLLPLSLLYFFVSYLRGLLAHPIRFPCKVICVGNISVGGTGKTQIVTFLAKLLKAKNINFVIVTKGYNSKLKRAVFVNSNNTALEVGDESVMLLKYGRVIAARKIHYIEPFIRKLKPSVIIIDDALQNPNFHKDFVILTIDGHRLFGNQFLVPAGPLRQHPKQALERADIIILVSATMKSNDYLSQISLNIKDKLFQAQIMPSEQLDKAKNYFAFSGIGNPARFFSTLENYGLKLLGCKSFPDHHQYSKGNIEYLEKQAKKHNSYLITTRKDYVKIYNIKKDIEVICCDVHLLINKKRQLIDLIYEKIL